MSFVNWTISKSLLIFSEKSLTYKGKIRGPNTVPCGTPWLTKMCSETMVPILTHCDLSLSKEFNKLTAGSEKLKHSAFFKKFFVRNELNAFARSKKIAAIIFPFSWFSITVTVKNNRAYSLNIFLISNPNCSLFNRSFSKSLAKDGVTEIGRLLHTCAVDTFLWIGVAYACFRIVGKTLFWIRFFKNKLQLSTNCVFRRL